MSSDCGLLFGPWETSVCYVYATCAIFSHQCDEIGRAGFGASLDGMVSYEPFYYFRTATYQEC